jgi:Icc-related predicted phosphoesterase
LIFLKFKLLFICYFLILGCKEEFPPKIKVKGEKVLRCSFLYPRKEKETRVIRGRRYFIEGFTMRVEGKVEEFRFGVLAGIEDTSLYTIRNLRRFVALFKRHKVDAIIVVGGMPEKREGMIKVLTPLVRSKLLIFTIVGATEDFFEYRKALELLSRNYSNLIDMTVIRQIKLGQIEVLTLPGYFRAFYLKARERGCAYIPSDIRRLVPLAKKAKGVVVFVSPGPPEGKGVFAIDFARGGVNVGDPNLTSFIKETQIKFGIFGHIHEAGGKGTDLEGSSIIPEGTWAKTLFLNPGPGEAVPWYMNDKSLQSGMAAIFHIKGKKARYKIFK